jgi:hypothetical protein
MNLDREADRMGQYPRKMCEVSFVNRKEAFGRDGLVQAIKHSFVQIARLVVHPRHDCIWQMPG